MNMPSCDKDLGTFNKANCLFALLPALSTEGMANCLVEVKGALLATLACYSHANDNDLIY